MEKDNKLGGIDDTEIYHDQQPSTSAKRQKLYVPQIKMELLSSSDKKLLKKPSTSEKQLLPRIKVNLVTPNNPRDESYMPSEFVCSVLRKFVDGEYGDAELEEILIMPSSWNCPSPPSLGEASNSKKICRTANSSATLDPAMSAEPDQPITFVPDHTPSTSAKWQKLYVPQIRVELLSSSDNRDIELEDISVMPPSLKRSSPPSLGETSNSKKICCTVNSTSDPPITLVPDNAVLSNSDSLVLSNSDSLEMSNLDPLVLSNSDLPVSSNSDPLVSSNPGSCVSFNPHAPGSSNPHPHVSSNLQPIAGSASSKSDPPMSSNPHPSGSSNPHHPVSSNPHHPVSSNPHPSGSSDPQPSGSSDPQPCVSSNFDPPMSSNPYPSVSSVPHIRKTQSTNVATPLTVTTRAQRNEYVKSLPSGFRLLNHLKSNNQCANFVGVVTDVTAPRQSKGSDYYTKIYIVDPFFSQCSREIMWFESPLHMPNIYRSGEIVLFAGIKCRNYKDQLQLIKNNETKIIVIPRNDDPEVMKAARTPHVQLHPKFARAIEVLKSWLAENIHLFDAVKFDLLSSVLEVDKYINICVNLCKMVYSEGKVIFTVWDGTIPSIKAPLRGVRKESTIEEKVVFDVTSEFEEEKLLELKVKGSFGTKTNMAEFKLKPKAVLAFYGVLVKKRKDGHVKLLLEDSDRVPLGFAEVKSKFIPGPYHEGRFNFKR